MDDSGKGREGGDTGEEGCRGGTFVSIWQGMMEGKVVVTSWSSCKSCLARLRATDGPQGEDSRPSRNGNTLAGE